MLWSELYHALALWLENGMKIMARICTLCVSLNTKSRPFAGLMNGRIINYKCRSPSERESEREREISNLNIVVMIVEWRRCYVTQSNVPDALYNIAESTRPIDCRQFAIETQFEYGNSAVDMNTRDCSIRAILKKKNLSTT